MRLDETTKPETDHPRGRGLWLLAIALCFLIGLGVGVARNLATLPLDDDSWLGSARGGWASMYQTMSGDTGKGQIEYFVYHPDASRQIARSYADTEPRIEHIQNTIYDSASVFVIDKDNRSVLSEIESQEWVRFAIRGELLFFCH